MRSLNSISTGVCASMSCLLEKLQECQLSAANRASVRAFAAVALTNGEITGQILRVLYELDRS